MKIIIRFFYLLILISNQYFQKYKKDKIKKQTEIIKKPEIQINGVQIQLLDELNNDKYTSFITQMQHINKENKQKNWSDKQCKENVFDKNRKLIQIFNNKLGFLIKQLYGIQINSIFDTNITNRQQLINITAQQLYEHAIQKDQQKNQEQTVNQISQQLRTIVKFFDVFVDKDKINDFIVSQKIQETLYCIGDQKEKALYFVLTIFGINMFNLFNQKDINSPLQIFFQNKIIEILNNSYIDCSIFNYLFIYTKQSDNQTYVIYYFNDTYKNDTLLQFTKDIKQYLADKVYNTILMNLDIVNQKLFGYFKDNFYQLIYMLIIN